MNETDKTPGGAPGDEESAKAAIEAARKARLKAAHEEVTAVLAKHRVQIVPFVHAVMDERGYTRHEANVSLEVIE